MTKKIKSREDSWPKGLYRCPNPAHGFRYRIPIQDDNNRYQFRTFGKITTADAKKKAINLNKHFAEKKLADKNIDAIKKIEKNKLIGKYRDSVKNLITVFTEQELVKYDKKKTRDQKIMLAKKMSSYFSDNKTLVELDVHDWKLCIEFCTKSTHTYPKLKVMIKQLYSWAKANAHLPANHANYGEVISLSNLNKVEKKKRDKMTIEQFKLLYDASQESLQDILKIGILTGLRIGDIRNLKFTQIRNGYLYVKPEKTSDLPYPRKLRYKITEEMIDAGVTPNSKRRINPKIPSKLVQSDCPFMFSWIYEKDGLGEEKQHINQILNRYFLKQYTETVKSIDSVLWTKYFDSSSKYTHPTFHEVRALYAEICNSVMELSEQEITKRLGQEDKTENKITKKYISNSWYEINEFKTFEEIINLKSSDFFVDDFF